MGGKRISRTGEEGPDIEDQYGFLWEVKRIKKMPVLLKKWLKQADEQNCVGVLFRENRGKWYVIMRENDLDEYLEKTQGQY